MKMTICQMAVAAAVAAVVVGCSGPKGVEEPTRITTLSGAGWTADGEPVSIPHTWNANDGADGPEDERAKHPERQTSLEMITSYERKAVTYRRALPDPTPGKRQFLRVGAAATVATVRVNGQEVGVHKGAFTAFCYELTKYLKPSGNALEIVVDNRRNVDIPPISGDYTMQGGLYRDVTFIETPMVCIDRTIDGGPGVELDIRMDGHVTATVHVSGAPDEKQEFFFRNPVRWSPETPQLYEVTAKIASGDAVTLPFGFRTVEFRKDGFYLNGRRRVLKGMNRHQEVGDKGWAVSAEDDIRDIAFMKEMGVDAVRTTHYPQSDRVYGLLDREGMVSWCEVPLLNGVTHSAAFEDSLRTQYRELVTQLKHHPSIVMWSIFNELYENFKMPDESAEPLVERFAAWAATVDTTRPQVAASDQVPRARLNRIPKDAIAFNRYPGWYNGPVEGTKKIIDELFELNPTRTCAGMSEYGGGGSVFQHGDPLTPCNEKTPLHTEEYQAYLHSYYYRVMKADPRIWGMFPWVMFDFASDLRVEGDHPGINDKGMMTRDRRYKKDVFYFYKANWTKTPVVHLVGKRMKRVGAERVNVLAFSNRGEVTLRVNGIEVAKAKPDEVNTVLFRDVQLKPGLNEVAVTAGGASDVAHWLWQPKGTFRAAWENGQRAETLKWFAEHQFGVTPFGRLPDEKIGERSVTFEKSGLRINITCVLPKDAKGPVPVFVFGDHVSQHEPPYGPLSYEGIPTNAIVARGYAFVTFNFNDVAPNAARYSKDLWRWPVGIIAYEATGDATKTTVERGPTSWGTIGAWAWGFSRVMDWIETRPELDAKRVAIVGHSRGGKTALWAGAQDTRFAMVVSNGSGCGGARLGRFGENAAEHFEQILHSFPNWFCPAFSEWIGRDEEIDHDADDLLRLIAPRLLYVESATRDAWAGPAAEGMAWAEAHDIWRDYGCEENMGRHVRVGPHKLTPEDWNHFMDFADRRMK